MSGSISFNRMPRIREPLPEGEIRLPAPSSADPLPNPSWLQLLLPLAGVFVLIGVYGSIRGDWLLVVPMVAISAIPVVTSIVGRLARQRHHEVQIAQDKTAYAAVLEQRRAELEMLRQRQRLICTSVDPDLETLLNRAHRRDPRLWERRPEGDDFLQIRLGMGDLPSTVIISVPHTDLPNPRLAQALALESEYSTVPGIPLTVGLRRSPLGIAGPVPARTSVARALVCNLVVHHSPTEVHLLALFSSRRRAGWQWLKWLPHTHALRSESTHRYLAFDARSADAVLECLSEELGRRQNQLYGTQRGDISPIWPWLVVLVEDDIPPQLAPALRLLLSPVGRQLNATAIILVDQVPDIPAGCGAVAEIQTDGLFYTESSIGSTATARFCRPDTADAAHCERLARSLAPLQARETLPSDALPAYARLLEVMGVEDLADYDVSAGWEQREARNHLRVPIGLRRGGQPLILNLSQTGHGPHGLLGGTTGSGKSELLQTLVVSLALTHHPYDVGFILVDYKGGGAFSGLAGLPHTQGLVTDLSGGLPRRALVALEAEMDRRKRLFNAAGVNEIGRYQQRYWQGLVDAPLPRLIVIVDEFAELISDNPDFIDGLVGIARVGRSLGLHLILATQSPAGVVKQEIWASARFRICLRVESRQESMEMLRRPDAANLERLPGRGYLQVGNNEVFECFQVARVAGCYPTLEHPGDGFVIASISSEGRRAVLIDTRPPQPEAGLPTTDLETVVEKLARAAAGLGVEKLPSPWPAPLPDHVALPDLLQRVSLGGWDGTAWVSGCLADRRSPEPSLPAVLGLLDDPARQRQPPLVLDMNQQDGHLLIIGAPGSGKAMLTRTLLMSLAYTRPPDQLHFYLLEFTGQALRALARLPHAGGLFTPLDDERLPRLFQRLLETLDERNGLCGESGVDRLAQLRERQAVSAPPAVVVVIAGLGTFRTLFQDEMPRLMRLVREGSRFGIHIVLIGDRVGDVPLAISSVVARRIVLRLADPSDYGVLLGTSLASDRADHLPPGRGWIGAPPLAFQAASPGCEKDEGAQMAELQESVDRLGRAWQGPRPEPVRTLPTTVPLRQVLSLPTPPSHAARLAVPVGLDSARLQPAFIDLDRDGPGFLIAGTPQSGKTTLLITWALALAALNTPQQIRFVFVAGRHNSLRPLERLPHALAYCRAPERLGQDNTLAHLQAEVKRRETLLDGPPRQISLHIVVMIDDYDAFASAIDRDPQLQKKLTNLVRRGRDVAVHTIAAGPLPNMGVGCDDPLIRQLKVSRSGFLLRALDPGEQNPLGVRIRVATGKQPPGRGYIVRNGFAAMLQVATAGRGEEITTWVSGLEEWLEGGG